VHDDDGGAAHAPRYIGLGVDLLAARGHDRGRVRTARRIAVAFAAVACGAAHAWGPDGHEAVGAVADELLRGTRAAAEVRALLGGLDLRRASVWADCAKGVSSPDGVVFHYRSDPRSFPECKPYDSAAERAAFESFARRNWKQCGGAHGHEMCHHQYHFADISTRRDGYDEHRVGARPYDVVHAVGAASTCCAHAGRRRRSTSPTAARRCACSRTGWATCTSRCTSRPST
jgi:hypothetical protein